MTTAHSVKRIAYSVLIMLFVAWVAYAKSMTSKELIDGASTLNGSIVTYKGEVITAIMNRGGYSWANLNDGYNAIGIWCRSDSLEGVRFVGDYKNEGDVLEVTGVFHRACPEHGGELDIHADSVKVETTGFSFEERFSVRRINVAIVFFILTLLAIFMLRKRL